MDIKLVRLSEEHTIVFKEEMQEAFQNGFQSYSTKEDMDGDINQWQVLPDKDFYHSLKAKLTKLSTRMENVWAVPSS